MRWQMSLYKEMAGKAEDAEDPEKVVKRVQEVSAVLYHIEVVSIAVSSSAALLLEKLLQIFSRRIYSGDVFSCFRQSIPSSQRKWCGTSCCPNSGAGLWWPVSG